MIDVRFCHEAPLGSSESWSMLPGSLVAKDPSTTELKIQQKACQHTCNGTQQNVLAKNGNVRRQSQRGRPVDCRTYATAGDEPPVLVPRGLGRVALESDGTVADEIPRHRHGDRDCSCPSGKPA
ncbi:MAG: putative circularly permuted ATP-grasp superfamily protein [Planctomycetaceae bacterium]|jgi:uncharacterized circularly permuted ATP-grasp superfamily protein